MIFLEERAAIFSRNWMMKDMKMCVDCTIKKRETSHQKKSKSGYLWVWAPFNWSIISVVRHTLLNIRIRKIWEFYLCVLQILSFIKHYLTYVKKVTNIWRQCLNFTPVVICIKLFCFIENLHFYTHTINFILVIID